jgi:hypothetical protein
VIKLMIVMFKEALGQADEHDAQAGERIGEFWGLPSCFKGQSGGPSRPKFWLGVIETDGTDW